MKKLAGKLAGWLAGRLAGWLAGWLLCCTLAGLAGWLAVVLYPGWWSFCSMASRPPQSALFLERDPRHARRLSTGCARIDACLGGGFDAHGLTEIAGAAGPGKTIRR